MEGKVKCSKASSCHEPICGGKTEHNFDPQECGHCPRDPEARCYPMPTKALSGYAEWFWLMAKNFKDVENRPWSLWRYFKPEELPIRIYLHASKTMAPRSKVDFILQTLSTVEDRQAFENVNWGKYRGNIIGETTITGQVEARKECHTLMACRSPWLFGPYGFWVQDGVLYDNPLPYRGQLGFFEVKL